MTSRVKKILLWLLAAALLIGTGQVQKSLNQDRERLDLTRMTPLKNAPPLLAFTTVAFGGFRGLISNFLWIRANDLQQADKYFEMVQLANWITDLEPHFAQVWVYQAWNMAWNISVNFTSPSDRWRWVQRGIELLRDDALRYNPDNILIYQQLSWIFQSKIGQNMDDANLYYKEQWAKDMTPFFGPTGTNFEDLINPQTEASRARARLFREKYKMDPAFVEKVNDDWGPLDWRTAEASAIYWAALGMEKAEENPTKVKQSDLIKLRRSIYQSMLQAFYHGRIVWDPFYKSPDFYPDLDLASRVNEAYETSYKEEKDAGLKQNIQTAQWNFLRDAVYFFYEDNRVAEAAKWFQYLCTNFPDKPLLDHNPHSLPSEMTLDQYAVACVQSDIGETDQKRILAAIQGLLARSYYQLAEGNDDHYAGYKLLATKVYERYEKGISYPGGQERLRLPTLTEINRTVLNELLDPTNGLPYAARAVLRTQLRLPPESMSTNAPAPPISTNATEALNTNLTNSVSKEFRPEPPFLVA